MLGLLDARTMYRARLSGRLYTRRTKLNEARSVFPSELWIALIMMAAIPGNVGAETLKIENEAGNTGALCCRTDNHKEPSSDQLGEHDLAPPLPAVSSNHVGATPALPDNRGQSSPDIGPDWRLQPFLAVAAMTGSVGESIPIFIEVLPPLINHNTSEEAETHVIFSHLPAGAKFSRGQDVGNSTWKVSLSELQGLTLTIEADGVESAEIEVTAITDFGGGTTASIQKPLSIRLMRRHPVQQDSKPPPATYSTQGTPIAFDMSRGSEGPENQIPEAKSELAPVVTKDPPPLAERMSARELNNELTKGDIMSDEQMVIPLIMPNAVKSPLRGGASPSIAPPETPTPKLDLEQSRHSSDKVHPVLGEEAHADAKATAAQNPVPNSTSNSTGIVAVDPIASAQNKVKAKLTFSEEKLIERGDFYFRNGDLVSARMYYKVAAETGSARAAFGMAQTYDPLVHKEMGVRGLSPEPDLAVSWYRRAETGGGGKVAAHLNALTSWINNQ